MKPKPKPKLNLKYLSDLPTDRHVIAVRVAGALSPLPGCLVKFALNGGATETILLISGPALSSYRVLKLANQRKLIPPLSESDHASLLSLMPEIGDADWDMKHDLSRVVAVGKLYLDKPGIGIEYVMQDGSPRRYWLHTKVARFYAEYLNDFKAQFENHVNTDDDPIIY